MKLIKYIKEFLNSEDIMTLMKGMTILYKQCYPELVEDVRNLCRHKNARVRSLARRILDKNKELSVEKSSDARPFESLEEFIIAYRGDLSTSGRQNLLKELNVYRPTPLDRTARKDTFDLYFEEENRSIANQFSKILIGFYGPFAQMEFMNRMVSSSDSNSAVNAVIGLLGIENSDALEVVVERYNRTTNPDLIYFSSCYLWKYSQLLVISRMKELAQGDENSRVAVAQTCITLSHARLKGIIEHLMEDPSVAVRNKARIAFGNLERKSAPLKSTIRYPKELSGDFKRKFAGILKQSQDFHEKIMVMNILDNLGQLDFLIIIEEELKTETNPFLIASYVKFLGKHGKDQYIEQLMPYLEHADSRVVANCIEGLAECDPKPELVDVYKKCINSKTHRIANMSAYALWKAGEKDFAKEHLERSCNARKMWRRKAALLMMDFLREPELNVFLKALQKDPNRDIRVESEKLLKLMTEVDVADSVSAADMIDHIVRTGKVPSQIIQERIKIIESQESKPSEKVKAALELSFIATDENYNALYSCFNEAEDNYLKATLVKTIGQTFSGGKEFLLDILKRDMDVRIIANALETLSFFDYKDSLEAIFPFLYHENQRVVINSVILLYKIIPDTISEKLSAMVESPNPTTRRSSMFALRQIGDLDCYIQIRRLLNDSDLDIAITASELISELDVLNNYKEILHLRLSEEKLLSDQEIRSMESALEDKIDLLRRATDDELEDIAEKIRAVLNEFNIGCLLKFIRSSNDRAVTAICLRLLGRFCHLKDVSEFVRKQFKLADEKLLPDTIKGLTEHRTPPLLIEPLLDCLASVHASVRMSALEVFMNNPSYGRSFFELIEKGDERVRPLTDILKKVFPQKEEKIQKTITAPVEPKKGRGHIKGFGFTDDRLGMIKVFFKGALAGCILTVIFAVTVLLLWRNPAPDTEIARDISTSAVPVREIALPERVEGTSDIQRFWNQIMEESSLSPDLKKSALLRLLDLADRKYTGNEFYRLRQMVRNSMFAPAIVEFKLVLFNIDHGLKIKDHEKGVWSK